LIEFWPDLMDAAHPDVRGTEASGIGREVVRLVL
jgi:hypothetical protein